jgi:hypothetical protein
VTLTHEWKAVYVPFNVLWRWTMTKTEVGQTENVDRFPIWT